jgi:putative ABC transport system permease protein
MESLVKIMLSDNLELAYKNIRKRFMRSVLTVLGIAIGIMGVIALMGLGEGMTNAVYEQLAPLSDTIIFYSNQVTLRGGVGGQQTSIVSDKDLGKPHLQENNINSDHETFTERDIEDMKRISGIKQIGEINSGYLPVSFDNDIKNVKILGIDPETMKNLYGEQSISEGKLINVGEQNRCVLGYSVANEYFNDHIKVNNKVLINGKKFVVKGIYKKEGGGLWSQNDVTIHVTRRDFEKITGLNSVTTLIVTVNDVNEVETIANQMMQVIMENHGEENTFSIVTMTSILERVMQVITIIQTVLLGIASIALVVASIGIMNMMLTSVIERTREIGIMKAIGATRKNIMFIFLSEGALISCIGGVVGVIFGYIGAMIICSFVSNYIGTPFTAVITPISVVFGLIVAFIVGVVFSFYPAKRAANMNPVNAIAYE